MKVSGNECMTVSQTITATFKNSHSGKNNRKYCVSFVLCVFLVAGWTRGVRKVEKVSVTVTITL